MFQNIEVDQARKKQTNSRSIQVPGNASRVIIGDLQEGITYTVSVTANTAVGPGEFSEPLISGR